MAAGDPRRGPAPHDPGAEQALIGGLLLRPERAGEFVAELAPTDFYVPWCASAFAAIADLHRHGEPIDAVTVKDRADRLGLPVHGTDLLAATEVATPPTPAHAAIVGRHARARRLQTMATEVVTQVAAGTDPDALVESLREGLDGLDSGTGASADELLTLDKIIERGDDQAPWVVPGLLRQDWRAMVVASEGAGKSTLLRQLAALAAQGLHPFDLSEIPPVRVLLVDAENPSAAIAETGARIVAQLRRELGDAYDPSRLAVMMARNLDLRSRLGRARTERAIAHHRPDLVILGPLYQLASRRSGERDDDATEPVLRTLDDLRTRHRFALVVEHHAPQAPPGSARELRPYGSSLLLRWPEIGLGLARTDGGGLQVQRWRGDRLRNDWPAAFERDAVWPWVGRWDDR